MKLVGYEIRRKQAGLVAARLIEESVYFRIDPLPDGMVMVEVKDEVGAKSVLEEALKEVYWACEHSHRHGVDFFLAATEGDASVEAIAAALQTRDPNHFEFDLKGESLAVTRYEPTVYHLGPLTTPIG